MNLTIKNFKSWSTDDGGGYQFTLYDDKTKIAFVHNAGCGGCIDMTYVHPSYETLLNYHVASLPPITYEEDKFDCTIDLLMEELVSAYEVAKRMSKAAKKGILFRLNTDSKFSFRSLNTLDLDKAKTYLDKKFPQQYQLV
jgi:hypothetical protein